MDPALVGAFVACSLLTLAWLCSLAAFRIARQEIASLRRALPFPATVAVVTVNAGEVGARKRRKLSRHEVLLGDLTTGELAITTGDIDDLAPGEVFEVVVSFEHRPPQLLGAPRVGDPVGLDDVDGRPLMFTPRDLPAPRFTGRYGDPGGSDEPDA